MLYTLKATRVQATFVQVSPAILYITKLDINKLKDV